MRLNSFLIFFLSFALVQINCFGQDTLRAEKGIDEPKNENTGSSFQSKIIADNKSDESASSAILASDTDRHIIVKSLKERKGLFAWRDSVVIPKRSAFYSLMFPGLGQINNRDYWKTPIVYGALGVGIYFFVQNNNGYNDARREYAYRLEKGSNNFLLDKYKSYDIEAVAFDRDEYKRLLDLTVMLSVAGYGLQVMEANAAAHLKGFDISDDISFKVRPSAIPTPYGILPGITFAVNFK